MMHGHGFAKAPAKEGKPLIVLIEYRSLAALRGLGVGREASVLPSSQSPARISGR
jgi:hypothetical protein